MENATTSTALEVTTDASGKRTVRKITLTGVAPKPRPKLATGVTAKNAPNSAKAVADAKGKAQPAKGKAQPAKGKAQPAKPAKPAPNADRKYKALMTFAETKVRPGTWTTYMVEQILRHTSTAKATEATRAERERSYKFPNGSPKPLDFNWAAKKGFIQFLD
jgi:hypothetical protein